MNKKSLTNRATGASIDNRRVRVNSEVKYGEFLLSSHNRTYGTNNRPIFELDHPVLDMTSIKLSYATVPRTWYNVNSTNNSITFEEDLGGGPVTVLIPVKNYSSDTFPAAIKAAMEGGSVNTYTYTVTFDETTLKITISTAAAFSYSVDNSFKLTGFSVLSPSATSHVGTDVINLQYSNTLLLRGDFGSQTGRAATVYNNNVYNNVITSIPVNEPTGSFIQYEEKNTDYFRCQFTAQTFEFYWTDDLDNIIDFNGVPWSIQISFTHLIATQ